MVDRLRERLSRKTCRASGSREGDSVVGLAERRREKDDLVPWWRTMGRRSEEGGGGRWVSFVSSREIKLVLLDRMG